MFRSFFLAGFECSTGFNRHGQFIDQVAATKHDVHVAADYARLQERGILAVREGIRWPLVDRRGRLDFRSMVPFARAARRAHIDVIWDLFHYGYPPELDIFSRAFVERFADYCFGVAKWLRRNTDGPWFFTPVNEISYLAWAGGQVGLFAPHLHERGFDLKVALVRAALSGIDALWEGCPGARIVHAEPVCRVVAPPRSPELGDMVRAFNEGAVFEAWDMLSGRLLPELGGHPRYLGVTGINYYWTNQWEWGQDGRPLALDDPRRVSLADLIRTVWTRYRSDVVITETSAVGDERAPWILELTRMAVALRREGIPIHGVCLYPVLGMPEWHAQDEWTRMGLWDLNEVSHDLARTAHEPSMRALGEAQRQVERAGIERRERARESPHQERASAPFM